MDLWWFELYNTSTELALMLLMFPFLGGWETIQKFQWFSGITHLY